MLTPERASQLGRIGAYRLHATHDPRETTRAAREAFLRRFDDEVDPDRVLPGDERRRRARYARKAYFGRIALKSRAARVQARAQLPAETCSRSRRQCRRAPTDSASLSR